MARTESCILCHAPIARSVQGIKGYRVCRICDITWCTVQDPMEPAMEWERDYYSRDDVIQLHEVRRSGMRAIIDRLTAVYPKQGLLLDVGAGIGILMQVAADKGWSVEGVEPSKTAADRARKLTGAPVHQGLLEEVPLQAGRYDAITILDILRSVPDPLTFLQTARRLLRPGGILLVREGHRRIIHGFRLVLGKAIGPHHNEKRRAVDFAQGFSPRSALYCLRAIGLQGWVEPSPLFVEPGPGEPLMSSIPKRAIGLTSAAIYHASCRRLIISPNLLAFGRAPE